MAAAVVTDPNAPGRRILARLIEAFTAEMGSRNEILLTAVGRRVDKDVYEPIAAIPHDVLPQTAEDLDLDLVAGGYGLERREAEIDAWLRERIPREVFGDKATRPALETALAGLFTPEAEVVEWIRDQWFVGRNYLGVNAWACDRTKIAFRALVRVNDTRKTIVRSGFFVGRSYVGVQYSFDEKLEYSVPMSFLWHLIHAVKAAGIDVTIEVLN